MRQSTLKRLLVFCFAFAWFTSPLVVFADTEQFLTCKQQLAIRASEAGISKQTIDAALSSLQLEQRVLDLDRRQPEFTDSLANYLSSRLTSARIEEGRKLMRTHRRILQQAADRFGVQPQYLVAFWGLETNFGSNLGKIPTLNSLSTLACDERRSEFFTIEFLEALRLLERGHIEQSVMIGSWAGAMGHTQFMPSTYMRHALDADGDGRIDLWRSVPDALLSAASYLNSLGWQRNVRWGREVKLPRQFDYSLAGLDHARALGDWREDGITDANGKQLPMTDIEAALLVPSGHRGPAFLVYENFRVIMRWNRSEYYALSVGLLADAIAGAPGLMKAPPADLPRLKRDQVLALQQSLSERGYDVGEHDGVLGPATRRAVQALQKAEGAIADGQVDEKMLKKLGVE
jgi:membrane-bound lytic murein transglycosylase B